MTKFFFSNSGTVAGVTPAFHVGWSWTADAQRRTLISSKSSNEVLQLGQVLDLRTYTLDRQYILNPALSGSQTITGFVSGVIGRSNVTVVADNIVSPYMNVRVFSNDGATLRGTLLALAAYGGPSGNVTLDSTYPGQININNMPVTGVACVDGDRLVVEVGLTASTAGAGSTAQARYGAPDNIGDFLFAYNQQSSLVPWISFSQQINFYGTSSCDDSTITPPKILEFPSIETLVLHWNFDSVTGSSNSSDGLATTSDAKFYVPDMSSGSLALTSSYYWAGPIRYHLYPGQGDFFLPYDTGSIIREYVPAAKLLPPEVLNSSDLIDVLSQNDLQFTRDSRPIKHIYTVEKSPYGIISEEMMKWFGTIADFNNLIGEPANRYRPNYKDLEKLKQFYFQKINNPSIDFEKFVDYFKWFDSSISNILYQLIPGSANFSSEIRTVIESHILERNKYQSKLPNIKVRYKDPEGGILGVNHFIYDWSFSGSAPVPLVQTSNKIWWNQRAERTGAISSGDFNVDKSRGYILSASVSALNRSFTTPVRILSARQKTIPRMSSSINTSSGMILPFAATDALLSYNKAYMPYYHEPKVVRITNIKNSKASASFSSSVSGVAPTMGNYSLNYEIVQTSGRTRNNRYLTRTNGTSSVSLDSPIHAPQFLGALLSGASNFSLPDRTIGDNKHIFVERFSAPGDFRTMSRGHLDQLAEEYSVYNNINYRNLLVRTAFNVSESIHSAQFGLNSNFTGTIYTGTVGNEHKVNRNTSKFMTLSSSLFVTASLYDNNFISRPIPQSEMQYKWVTASLDTVNNKILGYTNNFYVPTSGSSSSPPIFVSYITGSSNTGSTFSNLFVDFAGLNILIYDPIITGSNLVSASEYRNTSIDTISAPNSLNALLLHRNGPYEYPSWKQLRNTLHPIVRYFKNNNIISIIDSPKAIPMIASSGEQINYRSKRPETFTNFYEPAVSFKHKPLIHTLSVTGSSLPVSLRHSYGNNVSMFSNTAINNILGLRRCNQQMYNQIKDFYINSDMSQLENPVQAFINLNYREVVYPKENNTGLAKIRGRTAYSETNDTGSNGFCRSIYDRRTFWRDSETDRYRTFTGSVPLGSMNTPTFVGRSMWPLGRIFNAPSASSGVNPFGLSAGDQSGWLDSNSNELRGTGELNGIGPREMIAWNYRNAGSGTLHPFANAQLTPTASQTYVHYWNTRGDLFVNSGDLLEYPPGWYADVYSGKKPWFDSYNDYSSDIFRLAKEYSIIPEFRISDHMNYYVNNNGGNFRARNDSFLLNNGASITSSATSGSKDGFNPDFFKTYSHSDFMKYFEVIVNDHDLNNIGVSSISLKCQGIKKLLPYNGFYPVTRCLQLGSLLSQSVAPNIGGLDWKDGKPVSSSLGVAPNYSGTLAVQSLLQPFFAPGIVYNTIKSGIAVDWPAFTGSTMNFDGTVLQITDMPSYRIPFEALVDLTSFIPVSQSNGSGRVLFTPDATIASSLNSAGSGALLNTFFDWNGQKSPLFEMGMHNFLAESTNFFLKNKSFTTFVSKPSYTFAGQLVSGSAYFMDVDLFKTNDLVMFEGYWSQNGPNKMTAATFNPSTHCGAVPSGTLTTTGHWFGPALRFNDASPVLNRIGFDPGSAPYQPPYSYGKATARIKYIADGTETDVTALSKILNNSTITYFSKDRENFFNNTDLLSYVGANNLNNPAFSGSMQVSSSINLLGRSVLKKIEFNNTNTQDNKFVPQTIIDLDNQSYNIWTISPKFECPVLNFNEQPTVPCVTSSDVATAGKPLGRMPRGMWSGYGAIPTGSAGIYLSIRESFQTLQTGSIGPQLTGSLIKVCGFEAKSKKIGELADFTEISEAIVAIPFIDTEIDINSKFASTVSVLSKNFFSISQDMFNKQKSRRSAGESIIRPNEFNDNTQINKTSITDLIDKMERYIIPPELDFLQYSDIPPFVMYVFEFKHMLDKQDLSDIWQGLMPKISVTAEKTETSVTHNIEPWEFFESKKLPPNVRWMVFKIKKKAAINYFDKAINKDDARFKFDFKVGSKAPDYSYNWPYDFCSLIELAKIEAEVNISPLVKNIPNAGIQNPTLNQTGIAPIVRTNVLGSER